MTEIIKELKTKITKVVERTTYKGLLFSGGLDTSILAYLNPKTIGITISLGYEADDIPYSVYLAKRLNLKHFHKIVEIDSAIESIPSVIKILKSFDPAIPNDLAIYFGIRVAKDLGLDTVATGDGSDELFAGYSFMEKMADLEDYIRKIAHNMRFSSNEIGEFFGLKIVQPFMEKDIIDYALTIPIDLKIRKNNGKLCGKWVLRKAFESVLPKEIVWQDKRPIEVGSGMSKIRKLISDKVSDEEFKATHIKFINKEHFYYYKIYKKVVGEIPQPNHDEIGCPSCGAGIRKDGLYCRICGCVLNHH